jgi:predicted site-specific integrase-resolvase
MKIGYARVSTDTRETHLQMDALKRAKCGRVYEEKASGAEADRPELMKLMTMPERVMSLWSGSWIISHDHSANLSTRPQC